MVLRKGRISSWFKNTVFGVKSLYKVGFFFNDGGFLGGVSK
jgi:hypothetical protein